MIKTHPLSQSPPAMPRGAHTVDSSHQHGMHLQHGWQTLQYKWAVLMWMKIPVCQLKTGCGCGFTCVFFNSACRPVHDCTVANHLPVSGRDTLCTEAYCTLLNHLLTSIKDGVIREYSGRDRSLMGLQDFIEAGNWSSLEPIPWYRTPSAYQWVTSHTPLLTCPLTLQPHSMRLLGMLFSLSQYAKVNQFSPGEYPSCNEGIISFSCNYRQ